MKFDFNSITDILNSPKRICAALALCLFLGALWFVLVRAVTIDADSDHFHANFAVYVNGQREEFAETTFYEEVSSCGSEEFNPLTRVHMHDQINHVAHVHDGSSTWGNFFENLGFTLGNNVLYERTNTHVDGQNGTLTFVLNGEEVRSIANKAIQSEDTLLVTFGNESSEEIATQYASIQQDAAQYNEAADPSACTAGQGTSYFDRVKLVLGIE